MPIKNPKDNIKIDRRKAEILRMVWLMSLNGDFEVSDPATTMLGSLNE